ncbi:VanZ family protein [Alkalihalophilus pseudofirmus OF4]|uniref:VanZ family protein n=1 Tax=Alkalihalophilus pseudofirmus (strain ATCC BAA-2126 / JCM 17055 / OF4) TaxID=398511 RepID=D3FZP8_ALKPO|nr:VanZ family protein [Alkalihalophilus pseudofirmus]ADC49290.1 VanZ family protein [Alkalihalophilus pseudofirmus OF4]
MKNRKVLLTTGLLVLWAGMIIFASSQPYEDQDLRPILEGVPLDWVENVFGFVNFTYSNSEISVAERGPAAFIEFFIRKGAHVVVFAVLGALLMRIAVSLNIRHIPAGITALMGVFIFACIDEYRHLMNPERTGLFEDVILDTVGGAIGIAIYLIIRKKRRNTT